MKKLFKIIGVIAILFVIVLAAFIAYEFYQSHYWAAQKDLVSMTIEHSQTECHEKRPLKVMATNNSNHTVNKIEWDIGVFNKGYSTDLVSSGYHEYSHDKILQKNESWASCYSIPKTDGAIRVKPFKEKGVLFRLIYKIKNKYISFDFK